MIICLLKPLFNNSITITDGANGSQVDRLHPKRESQKEKHRIIGMIMRYFGGDEEDRTPDLTDANRTLSQLSYAPRYI